jgi:putative two-component system response regulator
MEELRRTVLVVDDIPENIAVLSGILKDSYKVKAALDGERALRVAATQPFPDLILLDVMMPGLSGYEVCRKLKADPRLSSIPVIFVTAMGEEANEQEGFEAGAVDYITKPVSPPIVQARVKTQLALYQQNRELDRLIALRTAELHQTRLQVIRRLGRAAEFKDNETGNHVIRMSHYSRLIGRAYGLAEPDLDLLFNAAPMHDIGKIGIPDGILLKPGKLDADEWRIMQKHPRMGAAILGEHDNELLAYARLVAQTHHECWDGSGYPDGLAGEAIPLVGRIVAIADVFDALTSLRPYKPAWTVEAAVEEIKAHAGQKFDPALIPAFMAALPEIRRIKEMYAEEHGSLMDLDLTKFPV